MLECSFSCRMTPKNMFGPKQLRKTTRGRWYRYDQILEDSQLQLSLLSTSGISVGFPNVHRSSAFYRRYCTPCRPSTSGSSLVMMVVGLVEWPPRRITWRHVGRQRQTPPDPSSCWWGPFPWRQCICCAVAAPSHCKRQGAFEAKWSNCREQHGSKSTVLKFHLRL